MKKLLKNPSTTEYVILNNIGLTLGPGEEYELTGLEKLEWVHDTELLACVRNGSLQVGYYSGSFFTDAIEGEIWFRTEFDETALISNAAGTELTEFSGGVVEDATTGKKSSTLFMDILSIMKELYNSSDNPIYDADFQPLIGTNGREYAHLLRTQNCEVIHANTGWHSRQIKEYGYQAPVDALFYYGWLNSFNSSTNSWTNELVAQDMSRYGIIVLGNGIADTGHGDYSNTSVIVPRIKQLNPRALVFGYVSCNQSVANFETEVDKWNTLHVDGIFMDESGYDYGTVATNGRVAFNTKVDYVHACTYSKLCFVNAWNMDHIIGTTEDVSYPNSTWNSTLVASNLTSNDWYLLESFAISTTSYTDGYETKTDWLARGTKAIGHRYTYGINICGIGVINNANASGQGLFNFLYTSALMWGLEAAGSSDTYYGASSAAVTFWSRLNVTGLGRIWSISPSITVNTSDNDIYYRFTDHAKLSIDFSSSAQTCAILRFMPESAGTSGTSGSSGSNGTSGTSGSSGSNGTSGTSGTSGSNGTSGTSGSSGSSGTSGTSPSAKALSSNFTTTSNTATSTNLTFAVGANEYWFFDCILTSQCSSTGGLKYAISAPTGSTIEGWIMASTSAITTNSYQRITAINTLNSTALHTIATTPGPDRIRFLVRVGGTAGNVTLQAASVTSGQTTTIMANSSMRAWQATLV